MGSKELLGAERSQVQRLANGAVNTGHVGAGVEEAAPRNREPACQTASTAPNGTLSRYSNLQLNERHPLRQRSRQGGHGRFTSTNRTTGASARWTFFTRKGSSPKRSQPAS